MDTNFLDWLSMLLVIVGALAWGVIGLTGLVSGEQLNVVALAAESVFLPAAAEVVANAVYLLVGVAGVYLFYTAYKMGRASRRTTSRSVTDVET